MIEACPTCLRYVFLKIELKIENLISNTTPRFLDDADGFVSSSSSSGIKQSPLTQSVIWPRNKHGKLFKNFFSLKFGPSETKFCFTKIKLQLKPHMSSRPTRPLNNVATSQEIPLGNELSIIGIKMLVYVKTGDDSAEWRSV